MKYWFIISAFLFLSGCLKEDPLNQAFVTLDPKFIDDGHILSSPSAENMDSLGLVEIYQSLYNDDNLWSLRSMLVFRNGRLVAESYFKDDDDIANRHLIWSCTKQFVGVLTGMAIEQGLIDSVDDPISKYLPEEIADHPDKADITIKNLLTMQSGIDYNNDGVEGETNQILQQNPDNSVDFILSRPLNETPGTVFHYNDGNPHLVSAILQKAAGKPTDVWADEVLFSKIEFTNYNWVRYKDGITLGGFGIETTPREMAKIALCVADSGKWKNQQIIDPGWIAEMTGAYAQSSSGYSFGYFWWYDSARDIHFMSGHGGQFAFIVPEKNLVVVFTSIPNTQGDYVNDADEMLPYVDRVIDAAF